jgi:uncharacterized membrane protein (UPF0127 family)
MSLEPCCVIHKRTGKVIADQGKIAREALLIYPCNSIHTFFMKFPIDVAFLDKQHKVVKIVQDMPAGKLQSCHIIAKSTLEMNSGSIARNDIKVGDTLIFD